jgi:hypothetical protein
MYLYSMQRIIHNSSSVLNLMLKSPAPLGPLSAIHAIIISLASAASRISCWVWLFAMTANTSGLKRWTTLKNKCLQWEGLMFTSHGQRTNTPVLHAKLLPEFQLFRKFSTCFDLERSGPVRDSDIKIMRHWCGVVVGSVIIMW